MKYLTLILDKLDRLNPLNLVGRSFLSILSIYPSSTDVDLTFESKKNQVWQYFPVVLFVVLYKVVLAVESVDKILACDHSNESY